MSARIIREWQQSLSSGRDPRRQQSSLQQASALMNSLAKSRRQDRSELLTGLGQFGHHCGSAGLTLADSSELVSTLNRSAQRRVRRMLDSRDAALAVAEGWMAGRGSWMADQAPQGVVRIDTMRLRVEQQHRQCLSLGTSLGDTCVLMVFEVDPLSSDGSVVGNMDLALATSASFTNGETVAACDNGRVLVLTALSAHVPNVATEARHSTEQILGLPAGSVRSWIEPLAFEILHLASHLDELST